MKSILFNVDELSRDAVVAANLSKALAKRGINLVYGTRTRVQLLPNRSVFDAAIFHNVDLIKETFKDPSAVTMPLILLPTEGVGCACKDAERFTETLVGSDYTKRADDTWARTIAAYCLWGQQQHDNMTQHVSSLLDRCHIVGHPRHDARCLASTAKSAKPGHKIRVGLITRFDPLNPFDSRSMVESIYRMRQSRDYYGFSYGDRHLDTEDMYYTNISDMRVLFDVMDRLDPETHEAYVRVHPRENHLEWRDLIARWNLPVKIAPWDQPFAHFVNSLDYMIAPPSTTMYDCLVCGTYPISVDRINPRRPNHLLEFSDDHGDILQFVERPQSIDELIELISKKPGPIDDRVQRASRILEHEEGYPWNRTSIDALADVCEKVVTEFPVSRPKSLMDRAYYELRSLSIEVRMRRGAEQSSRFPMTVARQKWIDNLAGDWA